jgi:hypothetical protein
MTDLFASYAGVRISSGSIIIPTYGLWTAEIQLPGGEQVPDDGSIVVGDLALLGHVYRQSYFAGSRSLRLIGGRGGWSKTIPRKAYRLANGVPIGMILKDAAAECGEAINVPNDSTVGSSWTRAEDLASVTLRTLAGANWYIDPAGIVQVKARPVAAVRTQFDVIDQIGALGKVTIATESYAAWMPGATFTSPFLDATYTIGGTMIRFDDDGIARLEILTR